MVQHREEKHDILGQTPGTTKQNKHPPQDHFTGFPVELTDSFLVLVSVCNRTPQGCFPVH